MSNSYVLARSFGPITRTDLVKYAGAGGDFNPIHHDEIFATGAGYPSVIGHGLLTAGLASNVMAEVIGAQNLTSFEVRYVGQVFPGDTLHVTVTNGDIDGEYTLSVSAQAGEGESRVVLTGKGAA